MLKQASIINLKAPTLSIRCIAWIMIESDKRIRWADKRLLPLREHWENLTDGVYTTRFFFQNYYRIEDLKGENELYHNMNGNILWSKSGRKRLDLIDRWKITHLWTKFNKPLKKDHKLTDVALL